MRITRFLIGFVLALPGFFLMLINLNRIFNDEFILGLALFVLGLFLVKPTLSGKSSKDADQ